MPAVKVHYVETTGQMPLCGKGVRDNRTTRVSKWNPEVTVTRGSIQTTTKLVVTSHADQVTCSKCLTLLDPDNA